MGPVIYSIIMNNDFLIFVATGFTGTSYFISNYEKFRLICFVFEVMVKWLFKLLLVGYCVLIYELFNKTFLLKRDSFISRVYYRSLIEGYAVESVMVFSTVLCLIYRFVFMGGYFLHMSGNTSGSGFWSTVMGSSGNTPTPPNPSDPPGPSTTNITALPL